MLAEGLAHAWAPNDVQWALVSVAVSAHAWAPSDEQWAQVLAQALAPNDAMWALVWALQSDSQRLQRLAEELADASGLVSVTGSDKGWDWVSVTAWESVSDRAWGVESGSALATVTGMESGWVLAMA